MYLMKLSIRTTIVLWTTLLFIVLMIGLSLFLHIQLKYYLYLNFSQYIQYESQELLEMIEEGCFETDLIHFFKNEIEFHSKDLKIFLRLLDQSGEVLFQSFSDVNLIQAFEKIPPDENFPLQSSHQLTLPLSSHKEKDFYLIVLTKQGKVLPREEQVYTLQVAFTLDAIHFILRQHLFSIAIAIVLITIFVIPVGWFIAAKALNSVHYLTQQAANLSAKNITEKRLPIRGTHDEIDQLAQVLNHMVERVGDSVKKIQRFTADAAHELRTPLTTIHGELELLQRSPHKFNEHSLEPVLEEISLLNFICNRLLFLAHIDEGIQPIKNQSLSLDSLLTKMVSQVQPLADLNQIQLVYEKNVPDAFVAANENVLSQVFLNLLENAFKYTDSHGSISVLLEKENDFAKITIKDTGKGIAPEHHAFIFDRFYRIRDESSKKNMPSSGLGLAIVKEVVEFHNGNITLESELKKGTTFIVRLPLSAEFPLKS